MSLGPDGEVLRMLKLPARRLKCPISEPSQQLCPNWLLTVGHQLVREVAYMGIGGGRQLQAAACGCFAAPPGAARYAVCGESMPLVKPAQKRVLFIRHGEGAHNASIANWGHVDPELNARGEAQVAALHEKLAPLRAEIELVAVSPLTRALQTATGGLAGTKAKWVVQPLLRERLGAPCDTGRTRAELLRCFPEMEGWEGMRDLPEVWWATSTEFDLFERVEALKEWIHSRPESTIAVVGHGGLFSRILGHHLKNCGYQWVDWSSPSSSDAV